jgi:hypothetical protein
MGKAQAAIVFTAIVATKTLSLNVVGGALAGAYSFDNFVN